MFICILEIREIWKIYGYMYIFNFDRKIRFKNYYFEIINKC